MIVAFILIVVHYMADFMFQTEDQALGKSKKFSILIDHAITYTSIFFLFFMIGCAFLICIDYHPILYINLNQCYKIWLFFPIIFVTHTIIDYFTSKIVSKKFENKEFYTGLPNFGAFSIIGLDQLLHYATLFLTYYILTN